MSPHPEPARVYHAAGARGGSCRSVDEVRQSLREAMQRHFFGETVHAATDEAFEQARWRRIVADTLPDVPQDRFEATFHGLWNHFAETTAWRLFDDVRSTLPRLHERGYSIAVASNFDARLRPILKGLKIDAWVDEVLISSDLGFSKPNPQFYEAAGRRLGVTELSRLLMIGDTWQGDVVAARQAGLDARHLVRDQPDALAQLTADL